VLEAVEDFCKRSRPLLALQNVEKRFQFSRHSASLLNRSEEGPEGGSFTIASVGCVRLIHVFPTPRGPK